MASQLAPTLVIALLFAAVHLLGRAMTFLHATPRSGWLSVAGGVSVAYVFVHLLPELAAHQQAFQAGGGDAVLGEVERHFYVVALAGLAIFYGLDRLARSSGLRRARAGGEKRPSPAVFWLHLGSYGIYNVLIGYLLVHREETDLRGLLVYAVAMGLHFVVNDQGLREQHGQAYDRAGRWLLAVAPLLGWGLGVVLEVPSLALSALFAFLAGGVVLNVLKEELPEERESRFSAFVAGTALYAALLLVTR